MYYNNLNADMLNGCCGATHVEDFGFTGGFTLAAKDPQIKADWKADEAYLKQEAKDYNTKYKPISFADYLETLNTNDNERDGALFDLASIVTNNTGAFISLILTDKQLEAYPKKTLKELGFKCVGTGVNNNTGNTLHFFLRSKPTRAKNPSFKDFKKKLSV